MIWQSNIHLTVAKLIIPIFTWTESRSFSSKSRTASWADVFRERAPFCSPLHTRPSLWYWTMGIVKKSCRPVTAQTADASINLCPSGDCTKSRCINQSVPIRWLDKKQMHQSICARQVTVQKADASINLCPSGDCTKHRCINQSVPIRWLYKQQMHHSVCTHQVTVQTADASFSLCPSGDCTNSRCIIQSVPIGYLYKQQMHHSVCVHQGTTICHAVLTVTQSWMPVASYW